MKKVRFCGLTFLFLGFFFTSLSQTMVSGSVENKNRNKDTLVSGEKTNNKNTSLGIAKPSAGILESRDGIELHYSYEPQSSKMCAEAGNESKYPIYYYRLTVTIFNGSTKAVEIDNAMVHSETDLKTLNHGLPCSDIPARNTAIVFISTMLKPGESKVMFGSDWVTWTEMPRPRYILGNIFIQNEKVIASTFENIQASNNQIEASQTPLLQQRSDQIQREFNNATNESSSAFQNSLDNGTSKSVSMVDATLEGAQYISDPKAALVYTGIGLGASLFSWISEKKEAQIAAMRRREEEKRISQFAVLREIKASLNTTPNVFNFISSSTNYFYTNLKIELKRGMVKSVTRKDLYAITLRIHKVTNTRDSIFIYESVQFKNLITSIDSCLIGKISIPLHHIREAQLFSGDLINSFDPKSSTNQIFRHKGLTNTEIKEAFTIYPTINEGDEVGNLNSNLNDVNIEMIGNHIRVQKRYSLSTPLQINEADFNGTKSYFVKNYVLVFDADNYSANKFVDYLNFLKD